MRLAAYVERSSEHNGDSIFVDKQSILAIIKDHVVHRLKVVIANEVFLVFSWNDRKVMDQVAVLHRQSVLVLLQHTAHTDDVQQINQRISPVYFYSSLSKSWTANATKRAFQQVISTPCLGEVEVLASDLPCAAGLEVRPSVCG